MHYHRMTTNELLTAAQADPPNAALVLAMAEKLATLHDRLKDLREALAEDQDTAYLAADADPG